MKKEIVKPVLFMAFNRPEKTKLVFEQIRKAQPRKLYLSVDAPREDYPDDVEKVKKVKEIVDNVDWECDVKRLYHDKNHGCSLAGKTAFEWVFSQEEDMIELEDDVVPSQSFFWYCQELLDKYRDDPRICYICAENYGVKSGDATYYFSKYDGSWGFATWKRVFDLWEYKIDSLEENMNKPEFKKSFPSKFEYNFWKRKFLRWKHIGGNTYDLQTIYLLHKYNMMSIVPNINLVTNIGWDLEASNTLVDGNEHKLAKKFGNRERFEIDEIIHPTEIKTIPKVDTKWFNYNHKRFSKLRYWYSWYIKPLWKKN